MKKKNNKKNTRRVSKKENKLKQKILEINLSKATIITSTIAIIIIALTTAGIIKTINESSKEKVETEEGEEYSPVNWIESTEIGEDGNYKKVPVPKGYVASQIEGETTVNGGFVIYEDNYNGKSINWDEIIIKDDSLSASEVSVDEGKEDTSIIEIPAPEVIPTEDVQVDETTMSTEKVVYERVQEEQGESVENKETPVNEENPVIDEEEDETKTNSEENTVTTDVVQEENGIEIQADGEAKGEETTEPEAPTVEQQTKKNIFELQKNVNQYVWVPVPDINRICGVDANGKLWGKLYNFNNFGTTPLNWTETEGRIEITNRTESYREPDITHYKSMNVNGRVKDYDYDVDGKLKRYMYGETEYEMLAKEMEQNFYETMKSIEKYGGYYIGRYETGVENSKAVIKKMNNNMGNQTWYFMYKRSKELAGRNENVKTSMIWGSLWDETLKWLVESEAKTSEKKTINYKYIAGSLGTYNIVNGESVYTTYNAGSWGNNYYNELTYIPVGAYYPEETATKKAGDASTSAIISTGSSEETKVNNIYDMQGNMWERTLEIYISSNRVYHGGTYLAQDSSTSVSARYSWNPDTSSLNVSSRATLIIKES